MAALQSTAADRGDRSPLHPNVLICETTRPQRKNLRNGITAANGLKVLRVQPKNPRPRLTPPTPAHTHTKQSKPQPGLVSHWPFATTINNYIFTKGQARQVRQAQQCFRHLPAPLPKTQARKQPAYQQSRNLTQRFLRAEWLCYTHGRGVGLYGQETEAEGK